MAEKIWKKLNYFCSIIPLGALFGLVIFVANGEVKDLDLWLHLAMGKFITLHHFVPNYDVLSCSIAGAPWVNHEWLFQVIVYQLFNGWGASGLLTMQVVLVAVTMLFLFFLGYQRDRHLFTAFLLLQVFLIYQQRFTTRPDLFSLLFFVIYIFVLSLHLHRRGVLLFLFVIQVIWTNMHGFFFFGPLLMIIGILSEWVKRRVPLPYEWNGVGRLTNEEFGRMWIGLVVVVLACLVNPLFIEGAIYPIKVFFSLAGENKIFFDYIQELQRPLTLENVGNVKRFAFYQLFILISFCTFIFNRRRVDISALFLWLFFLLFSLKASRNMPFFAFAAYLVMISNLGYLSWQDIIPIRFLDKRFECLTGCILSLLLAGWIFNYFNGVARQRYYDFDKYEYKSAFGGISLLSYPDGAVDFLVDNDVEGNFFNDFNSGAYLLGRAFPKIKVFMDGRTEVYGGRFFKRYYPIWEMGDVDLFNEAVERFQITGALLNSSRQHIPEKLIQFLYEDPQWVLVYFDNDGVVFLKDVPKNKAVIESHSVDLAQQIPISTDLYRMSLADVLPYEHYYRAFTLMSMGKHDLALAEAQLGLKINPMYAELHQLLGKIYSEKKQLDKAFEYFRIAAFMRPRKLNFRNNMARAYLDTGHYEGAIKEFEAIIEKWPQDAKAYFFLAKAYLQNEQYDQVIPVLKQAMEVESKAVPDVLHIADKLVDQGAWPQALAAFRLVEAVEGEKAEVWRRKGKALEAMGQGAQAQVLFKKAQALEASTSDTKNAVVKEDN